MANSVSAESVDGKVYHECGAGPSHLVECKYHNENWNDLEYKDVDSAATKAAIFMLQQSPYFPGKPLQNYANLMQEMYHPSENYCGAKEYIIQSVVLEHCPLKPDGYRCPFNYHAIDAGSTCFLKGKGVSGFRGGPRRKRRDEEKKDDSDDEEEKKDDSDDEKEEKKNVELGPIGVARSRSALAKQLNVNSQVVRDFEVVLDRNDNNEEERQEEEEQPMAQEQDEEEQPVQEEKEENQPVEEKEEKKVAPIVKIPAKNKVKRRSQEDLAREEAVAFVKPKPLRLHRYKPKFRSFATGAPKPPTSASQQLIVTIVPTSPVSKPSVLKEPKSPVATPLPSVVPPPQPPLPTKSVSAPAPDPWAKLVSYFESKTQAFKDQIKDVYTAWVAQHPTLANQAILNGALQCVSAIEAQMNGDLASQRKNLEDVNNFSIQKVKQNMENTWLPKLQTCVQQATEEMRVALVKSMSVVRETRPPMNTKDEELLVAEIEAVGGEPQSAFQKTVLDAAKSQLQSRIRQESVDAIRQDLVPAAPQEIDEVVQKSWPLFESAYRNVQQKTADKLNDVFEAWKADQPMEIRDLFNDINVFVTSEIQKELNPTLKCDAYPNGDYKHYVTSTFAISRAVLRIYETQFMPEFVQQCVASIYKRILDDKRLDRLKQKLQLVRSAYQAVYGKLAAAKPTLLQQVDDDAKESTWTELINVIRAQWLTEALPLMRDLQVQDLANALSSINIQNIIAAATTNVLNSPNVSSDEQQRLEDAINSANNL